VIQIELRDYFPRGMGGKVTPRGKRCVITESRASLKNERELTCVALLEEFADSLLT
jgi:hypothetical protein